MPSVRQIRRRIRSVQNTAKITKAMSMVAASKMRRAQDSALKARPYSDLMRNLLANLAAQEQSQDVESLHPLLQRREVNTIQLVHITPDRGLTGGLGASINRTSGQFILGQSAHVNVIAVGKKGRDFMVRTRQDVLAVFTDINDRPALADISPIAQMVIQGFRDRQTDAVYLSFPRFVSTTTQRPVVEPLLPVVPESVGDAHGAGYIYEPSSLYVLSELLPRFVEMQIYHAVLESIASEQSARMVAMRNATDNANSMEEDLTLVMNKARQEAITTELLDIVGGAAAIRE